MAQNAIKPLCTGVSRKNMMKLIQLWFHLNQNIAWRSTYQQNLLNGGSKCGDMLDKVVYYILSNKVLQDLMMVLVAIFSNSHHRSLHHKPQGVHWKLLNTAVTLIPAVEKGKYYLGTIGMNRVHDWHMMEKKTLGRNREENYWIIESTRTDNCTLVWQQSCLLWLASPPKAR